MRVPNVFLFNGTALALSFADVNNMLQFLVLAASFILSVLQIFKSKK